MTKLASVSFTTHDVDEPSGLTAGGFSVALFLANMPTGAPVAVANSLTPVPFTIPLPGSYHVEVTRVALTGEAMAAPAKSDPFIVPPNQIAVPLTVTVVLSDAATPVAVPATVTVTPPVA